MVCCGVLYAMLCYACLLVCEGDFLPSGEGTGGPEGERELMDGWMDGWMPTCLLIDVSVACGTDVAVGGTLFL